MIHERVKLQALTPSQLRATYMRELGKPPHKTKTVDGIISDILSAMAVKKPIVEVPLVEIPTLAKDSKIVADDASHSPNAPVILTEAEVRTALKSHIASGLDVSFDDETVNLRMGRYTESCNRTIPLGVLRRCAQRLMESRPPRKVVVNGEEVFA